MRRIFSLLLIAVLLSSCGLFRNVKRDKFSHDVKTKVELDSNVVEESISLDRGKTVELDQGTTITERTTTKTTKTKGANVNLDADLLRLSNGETITKDSAGITIRLSLDSLSNKLKVGITLPDQETTEETNEKITENANKRKEDQRDESKSSNLQVAVSSSSEKKESTDIKNVEKEGKNAFWYVVVVLSIALIIAFLIYLRKKSK